MKENIFTTYANNKNLYLIQLGTGSVLFKLLSYDKSRIAERICKEFPSLTPKIEEDIWDECVIEHSFPKSMEQMNAGVVGTVVRVIIKLSAPRTIEEMQKDLEQEREKLKDIRDQIIVKICEAFPGYTPDEVAALDWPTLVERLSQAEKILGAEFIINAATATGTTAPQAQPKQPVVMPTKGVAMKQGTDGNQYIDFDRENAALMRDL
jgi:hypothetical protein